MPAGRDPKHGGPAGQRAPQCAAAAAGLPTGLVDVDGRGLFDPLLELRVRAGERVACAFDDRIDRAGRKLNLNSSPGACVLPT